jgi:hypothetical protein
VKEEPVVAVPLLEIREENEVEIPTVADVGLVLAAVKFGWAGTDVIKLELAEYPVPVEFVA